MENASTATVLARASTFSALGELRKNKLFTDELALDLNIARTARILHQHSRKSQILRARQKFGRGLYTTPIYVLSRDKLGKTLTALCYCTSHRFYRSRVKPKHIHMFYIHMATENRPFLCNKIYNMISFNYCRMGFQYLFIRIYKNLNLKLSLSRLFLTCSVFRPFLDLTVTAIHMQCLWRA